MSLGQLVLDGLQFAAMAVLARDMLRLDARVEAVERGNEREDKAERDLRDENTQVRAELDSLHAAVDFLRRACPKESLTSWDESRDSTREYAGGAPTLKSGQTQFKSNEPPLPSWFNVEGDENYPDPCGICGALDVCEHDD